MRKGTSILIALLMVVLGTADGLACLSTYQFKSFPVGVTEGQVVSLDVKVIRSSQAEGGTRAGLEPEELDELVSMWSLLTYVSVYDEALDLLSYQAPDTVYCLQSDYSDSLAMAFDRVALAADTSLHKDYVIYQGERYETGAVQDSTHFGYGHSAYHPYWITGMRVNSIRVLRSKSFDLLAVHLISGHELSMGYITSDPDEAGPGEYGDVRLAEEYSPDLQFSQLSSSTYMEPLLHHAYGFDVLVLLK